MTEYAPKAVRPVPVRAHPALTWSGLSKATAASTNVCSGDAAILWLLLEVSMGPDWFWFCCFRFPVGVILHDSLRATRRGSLVCGGRCGLRGERDRWGSDVTSWPSFTTTLRNENGFNECARGAKWSVLARAHTPPALTPVEVDGRSWSNWSQLTVQYPMEEQQFTKSVPAFSPAKPPPSCAHATVNICAKLVCVALLLEVLIARSVPPL